MEKNTWQLQEAKSKFSQLVEDAQEEPQFVTKHGYDAVVVLSIADYQKITKPAKNLVSFLKNSPLKGIELDLTRNRELPREMDL